MLINLSILVVLTTLQMLLGLRGVKRNGVAIGVEAFAHAVNPAETQRLVKRFAISQATLARVHAVKPD
jgi:hypothetical protein